MNCPNCNTQVKPDMTFCGRCGKSLADVTKETVPIRPSGTVKDPEEMEKIFTDLVAYSWKRYDEILINKRLDEVLIGLVIASNVKSGYSLIDISSDGVNHYLRFENLSDGTRLIFRLTNLSEDLTQAKVLGHVANVTIGYGEKVRDLGKIWQAFKAEVKSTFLITDEPGIITCDADLTGGYIYAQIPLIFNLDNYLDKDHTYRADVDLLQLHINSTVHSLRKYLKGRLSM